MNTQHTHNKEHAAHSVLDNVISRIEGEAITPTPRWHFLLHEGVVWSLGGVAVVVGALSVAGIIFTGQYSDWEYYEATHDTFATFVLDIVPYTWLITLAIFGAVAYLSVRHTKRGYRYTVPVLVMGAVGVSTVMGAGFAVVGMGRFVDEDLGSVIPLHHSLKETKLGFWNQPERGIVAGIVSEIGEDGTVATITTVTGVVQVSLEALDESVREAIEVGSALRILAPRQPRTPPPPEQPSPKASDTEMVMMTMTAPEGITEPDSSYRMTLKTESEEDAHGSVVRMRQACLILPLDWDRGFRGSGTSSEELRKRRWTAASETILKRVDMREECIKTVRKRSDEPEGE